MTEKAPVLMSSYPYLSKLMLNVIQTSTGSQCWNFDQEVIVWKQNSLQTTRMTHTLQYKTFLRKNSGFGYQLGMWAALESVFSFCI